MIQSFGDSKTEKIFRGIYDRETAHISRSILQAVGRKLDMLDYAAKIIDLASPPGNRLEKLKDNLDGFWSIRVNRRWRIIFRWYENNAYDVRIIDYHK